MTHLLIEGMEHKLVPGREEEALGAAVDRLIAAVGVFSRVDPDWRAKLHQRLPPHSEPWEFALARIDPDMPIPIADLDVSSQPEEEPSTLLGHPVEWVDGDAGDDADAA